MLFNSLEFAAFFAVVYGLYLILNHRWQNRMLLVASYVFYGAWDWRFLSLIWISTVLDFSMGLLIDRTKSPSARKRYLVFSVAGNLLILGSFKYFNFFVDSLTGLVGALGLPTDTLHLNIVLPVGISFYTFQTLSYTIDIYRGQLKPTRRFLDFALFVAFFPQLVAGPIEKAKHLLPQILAPRTVTLQKFYEGMYLIFWGLFLKVFVADNLAKLVDPFFAGNGPYNGLETVVVLWAFSFQILGDFAGYSNIARGIAKCMGFELVLNFDAPYFAGNPRDFWRRWHISLSSWFQDYVYIPMGGNRHGPIIMYWSMAMTMLLSGLWHGANWTFLLWGAYHGVLLALHRAFSPWLHRMCQRMRSRTRLAWKIFSIVLWFQFWNLGWTLFRAESLGQTVELLRALFVKPWKDYPVLFDNLNSLVFFAGLAIVMEYVQYREKSDLAAMRFPFVLRATLYVVCFYLFILYGAEASEDFIYFQF